VDIELMGGSHSYEEEKEAGTEPPSHLGPSPVLKTPMTRTKHGSSAPPIPAKSSTHIRGRPDIPPKYVPKKNQPPAITPRRSSSSITVVGRRPSHLAPGIPPKKKVSSPAVAPTRRRSSHRAPGIPPKKTSNVVTETEGPAAGGSSEHVSESSRRPTSIEGLAPVAPLLLIAPDDDSDDVISREFASSDPNADIDLIPAPQLLVERSEEEFKSDDDDYDDLC